MSLTAIQGHLWNLAEFLKTQQEETGEGTQRVDLEGKEMEYIRADPTTALLVAKGGDADVRVIDVLYLSIYQQLQVRTRPFLCSFSL